MSSFFKSVLWLKFIYKYYLPTDLGQCLIKLFYVDTNMIDVLKLD